MPDRMRRRGGRVLIPGEAAARGGLILPNEGARRGVPTLHVPAGYETGPPPVMVGTCTTCDHVFHRGEEEEWQRHVGWCARQHLPDIMAEREAKRQRLAIFDESTWDPEVAEHMQKVGKRMLREGRMEVKPSERAGFS